MPYFDVLRGLAILGVVAIHSTGEGLNFTADSFNFNFTLLWRQIINFSVPLFLSISGFFMARKNINSSEEYFLFLKNQIPKVYIPCMFWSLIALLVAFFLFGKPLLDELFKMLSFQAVGPYYFIALIIQFYILFPVLKIFSNIHGVLISAIVSLTMTILIFYIRYYTNISFPLIIYAGLFPTWVVFFVYGLYLGSGGKISISNKSLVLGILISYLFSCIESYCLYSNFNQAADAVTAVKPTSFIYSLFVISFLFKNIGFVSIEVLKTLGKMSFGIYLIHMFILPIAMKALKIVLFPLNMQPGYQFGLVIITTLGCYIIILLFQMLFNKKMLKIIGF
jgi:surface polysaccharide O-acyltransferase-like enzyme